MILAISPHVCLTATEGELRLLLVTNICSIVVLLLLTVKNL